VEPAIVMVHVVCSSVCHIRVSPKLSKIDVWLLGKLNRNLGFPVQNLPPDSQSEVQFRRTTLGTAAGQLSSCLVFLGYSLCKCHSHFGVVFSWQLDYV